MLKINLENVFEGKVKKNGIDKREFELAKKSMPKAIKALQQKHKSGEVGFFDLPAAKTGTKKILEFAKKNKGKYSDIVIVGIGGSSLGGQALLSALAPATGPRFHFIDHMDSLQISEIWQALPLKKTLFIVISKSGGTIESMALYFYLQQELPKKLGKNWVQHIVTITDPKDGLLRAITKEHGFANFEVPQNVGGRFSALSAVGLLPAALAGIDISKLLKGAQLAAKNWGSNKLIIDLALSQYLIDILAQKQITVLFPYSKKLEKIADWYIQLLAESIGKTPTTGPTPIKAVGPTDQHSQVQLFMEGPNNKFFIFVGIEKVKADFKVPKAVNMGKISYIGGKSIHQINRAEQKATTDALTKMQRPNITIDLNELSPENVGALIFSLQIQVAILGELYVIDAFNQPGVELGKVLTQKYL